MPWTCFIVEDGVLQGKEPGAMFPIQNERYNLTDWYVLLPNGAIHNIHAVFPDGSSWTVTGQAPNLTVSPSIRCYESPTRPGWHGWLQNGVLSDDIEGRTY